MNAIDNIVFGIMDLAAGIAYAFPGVGTAIGLGVLGQVLVLVTKHL